MKAIEVTKPFHVAIVDVKTPTIQNPDEVLIKITSGGICGSDIGIFNGTNSLATYPRIIGHEFGGIIEAIGENVIALQPGDKVAVDPVISCGVCYACKSGHHNVCRHLEVMGVHRNGGFAEYVVAPMQNVYKIANDDFDSSLLSLVEPYSIGMEICKRAQVTEGDRVLIMGAGPIGICAMQVAKSFGAKVIMSDLVASRLERAKNMGADETVLVPTEDLETRLLEFTGNEGIPVIIDTVCQPFSFEQSVALACPAGRIVVLGLKAEPANISMAEITKKELTIVEIGRAHV